MKGNDTHAGALAPGARTIRMCSLDGRSGTCMGAIPEEKNKQAWKGY
jgi:hypothetical protein